MESQKKRAGGTVCIKNLDVWKSFNSVIKSIEACILKSGKVFTEIGKKWSKQGSKNKRPKFKSRNFKRRNFKGGIVKAKL